MVYVPLGQGSSPTGDAWKSLAFEAAKGIWRYLPDGDV